MAEGEKAGTGTGGGRRRVGRSLKCLCAKRPGWGSTGGLTLGRPDVFISGRRERILSVGLPL